MADWDNGQLNVSAYRLDSRLGRFGASGQDCPPVQAGCRFGLNGSGGLRLVRGFAGAGFGSVSVWAGSNRPKLNSACAEFRWTFRRASTLSHRPLTALLPDPPSGLVLSGKHGAAHRVTFA